MDTKVIAALGILFLTVITIGILFYQLENTDDSPKSSPTPSLTTQTTTSQTTTQSTTSSTTSPTTSQTTPTTSSTTTPTTSQTTPTTSSTTTPTNSEEPDTGGSTVEQPDCTDVRFADSNIETDDSPDSGTLTVSCPDGYNPQGENVFTCQNGQWSSDGRNGNINDPISADIFSCQDIDECITNPCHTNATCVNRDGSFTCTCNDGYDGDGFDCTLQDVPNPCDPNPCNPPNGDCALNEADGSFTCTCNDGYTGDNCQTQDVPDPCSTVDCGQHGSCSDGSCICSDGYGGTSCQDINECDGGTNPCGENSTCTNTDGSFTCACNNGFSGTDDGTSCTDTFRLNLNAGTSGCNDYSGDYKIFRSDQGDTVFYPDQDSNVYKHITNNYYIHKINVRDGVTSWALTNIPGNSWDESQVNDDNKKMIFDDGFNAQDTISNNNAVYNLPNIGHIDPYWRNNCDGSWNDGGNDTGIRILPNICPSVNPCQNNGTCNNGTTTADNITCTCSADFTGDFCETPVVQDPCAIIDCGRHGTCSGGTCTCRDGYSGSRCGTAPGPAPDPCDGVCDACQDGFLVGEPCMACCH